MHMQYANNGQNMQKYANRVGLKLLVFM